MLSILKMLSLFSGSRGPQGSDLPLGENFTFNSFCNKSDDGSEIDSKHNANISCIIVV